MTKCAPGLAVVLLGAATACDPAVGVTLRQSLLPAPRRAGGAVRPL